MNLIPKDLQEQITVENQKEVWSEVGHRFNDVQWGFDYWDIADDLSKEYIIIKKEHIDTGPI